MRDDWSRFPGSEPDYTSGINSSSSRCCRKELPRALVPGPVHSKSQHISKPEQLEILAHHSAAQESLGSIPEHVLTRTKGASRLERRRNCDGVLHSTSLHAHIYIYTHIHTYICIYVCVYILILCISVYNCTCTCIIGKCREPLLSGLRQQSEADEDDTGLDRDCVLDLRLPSCK